MARVWFVARPVSKVMVLLFLEFNIGSGGPNELVAVWKNASFILTSPSGFKLSVQEIVR